MEGVHKNVEKIDDIYDRLTKEIEDEKEFWKYPDTPKANQRAFNYDEIIKTKKFTMSDY